MMQTNAAPGPPPADTMAGPAPPHATRPRARPAAHRQPAPQPQSGATRSRPSQRQEFMHFARCLDARPREAPKSLLLRDLCALCASALNPCLLAGLPAEPEPAAAARAPGLRLRANPPPTGPGDRLNPSESWRLGGSFGRHGWTRRRPIGTWSVATRQAGQAVAKCESPALRPAVPVNPK